MSDHPQASVVLTVYNDLRFLDAAVDSILQQEFRDFELVIVDDGTGEDAIFRALEHRDPRVRLVVNPMNLGGAAAANRGIAAARSEIIVRHDADDVAEPERLGRLIAALADDPQLGLVGSAVTLIDEHDQMHGVQRMPATDLEIRWTILFHNPFYHPAVAFRRQFFEAAGEYRVDEIVSYDHYLWFDMLPFCRARNLTEPLARYRVNPRGLTSVNSRNPRNRTHSIRETLWKRLGLAYDLYDDALAKDVTQWLRGQELAPERRGAAYRVILTLLHAFLAAARPFKCVEDAESARRLASDIIARMVANQPARMRDAIKIFQACWKISRSGTLTGMAEHLADRYRSVRRAAARRFLRLRLR